MTIPTQNEPAPVHRHRTHLNFTGSGSCAARFYARVGVEHFPKESDD